MTVKSRLKKIVPIICDPYKFFRSYQKIVLLSHMRGRTSVLSHVIGGHNEISGYYEQHVEHKKKFMEEKIKINLLIDNELKAGSRYLYDKVLHSNSDPQSLILYRVIVMVREPEASIKSIIAMGKKQGSKWSDMESAVTYYKSRLSDILCLLKANPAVPFCFITTEYFVNNTEDCLNILSGFIGVKDLSPDYEVQEKTSKRFFGDTSENIRAGTVIKTKSHDDIVLDKHLLCSSNILYQDFIKQVNMLPNKV
ncbi:MAG: hypothetical protein HRU04_13155 [Oceanospirillaceae bacterium]|nr:hypothetical protein [Oceanospirillaceae bacterium]